MFARNDRKGQMEDLERLVREIHQRRSQLHDALQTSIDKVPRAELGSRAGLGQVFASFQGDRRGLTDAVN